MLEKFSIETLEAIFDALPVDLTFVDEADIVRYYNRGDYAIFRRTPEAIGRTVQDCHSQESLPRVNKVIGDLKSGRKKVIEYWSDRKGRKIHIRYLPVKDKTGRYIGTIEVAQDITDIHDIPGKKDSLM